MRRAAFILLLLLATGCHSESLSGLSSSLRFELVEEPASARRALIADLPTLTFPMVYAGFPPRVLSVDVINDGRVNLEVEWTSLLHPFSSDLPNRLPPGPTRIDVRCDTLTVGTTSAVLEVSSSTGASAQLPISASALAPLTCSPSSSCVASTFDAEQGRCIETPVPDGTTCDAQTLCLLTTSCRGGRCVGQPVSCDDGNACTVDVCHAQTGCEHLPAPPCPGDSVCQIGVCNPRTGCERAPAPDGTRCGPSQSCVAAEVCISGACVTRDPPDGYVCDEASPCSDEGRCVGSACVHRGPPTTMISSWSLDSQSPGDGGIPPLQLHDFVLEPSGSMTLGGFFSSPGVLRANTPAALPAPEGNARRCIIWNGRLVCADYPSSPNGRVTALNLATGATEWTFNIYVARPAYSQLTSTLFLARLVVMGSDRLAAVYEAFPDPPPSANKLCRTYFLVVMDASGHLVTAQPISDPLLDVCNHPHPYGAASDLLGNLYIAFSPTANNGTPLLPDHPTLLVSYTRDGVFRWKVLSSTMTGGELAIARGLLYSENSPEVLSSATGETGFTLAGALGRAVVSETKMVPAPVNGTSILSGYEAGTPELRWTHEVPPGFFFWGEQLRLGRWSTSSGEKSVAVTFITDAVTRRLHAVDVQNGQTAFSCVIEMPSRTSPQLFEIGNQHLAVMHGALDSQGNPSCGKCDPPFAGASAAFQTFDTKTLFLSPDPWPGTFGGPAHDHHEKPGETSE